MRSSAAPERCIMVGDRHRAHIEGAKPRDMNAVWVCNRSNVFAGITRSDHVFERLAQIKNLPMFGPSPGLRHELENWRE